MSHPYTDALSTCLPSNISLSELSPDSLETLIRFLVGAPQPDEVGWASKQAEARSKLEALVSSEPPSSTSLNGIKRKLEAIPVDQSVDTGQPKRAKLDEGSSVTEDSLFTFHSISVTSPVRKKVDINITPSSVTFTHPTTHALEASIPKSSIKRSFLVPTRGKSKPHWTIIFIPSDIPYKGKEKNPPPETQQIIFGLDAVVPGPASVVYTTPTEKKTLKKGDETHSALLDFIAAAGVAFYEPSTKVFKSAYAGMGSSASPDGIPGAEGYRGAKQGTIWFMNEGMLWGESKPCEFWAVADLQSGDAGVRVVSPTGRTCSVYLTRRASGIDEDGDGGIIDGEETEFAMVDGKEQEGIGKWVRERRHLFGAGGGNPSAIPSTTTTQQQPQQHISTAAAGSTTIASMNLASDDEDEDFAASSSDSDSGSDSDSSSDEDAEGEDEAEDTDASGEEDEQEAELDPSKHPLLRPGAMPKNISRAAVDMAVGLVEEDVVMGGPNEDGGEDEVDELED